MAQLRVVTLSQTGKTRRINEDCFLNGSYVPDHFTMGAAGDGKINYQRTMPAKQTVCLAVFDEIDDESSNGTASLTAANELKSEINRLALLPLTYVDALMQRYINRVNEQIGKAAQTGSTLNRTGTMFACMCLRGKQAAVYNFGDCSVYLYRQTQFRLMTTESRNDSDKGTARSQDYLGMPAGSKPLACNTSSVFTLQDHDHFLLCSKSLTDYIDDATIRSCLSYENPQFAADQLMSMAHAKGCQKSVTITVARWSEKEDLQQIRVTDADNSSHRRSPNPRIEHEHRVFKIPVEKKKIKPEVFKMSHVNFWQNIPIWLQILNLIALMGLILFLIWLFNQSLFG